MKISELPEDIQYRAKKNVKRQNQPQFEDSLGLAFMWTATPEGQVFWTLCNSGRFDEARKLLHYG